METKQEKYERAKATMTELFATPVIEDSKAEEMPTTTIRTKSSGIPKRDTIRKTFNIPKEMDENINILIYMNRDIKDYTELVLTALGKYITSKSNQELIEEYSKIKK